MKTLFVDTVGWGILIGASLAVLTISGIAAAGDLKTIQQLWQHPLPYFVLIAGFFVIRNYNKGWKKLLAKYEAK